MGGVTQSALGIVDGFEPCAFFHRFLGSSSTSRLPERSGIGEPEAGLARFASGNQADRFDPRPINRPDGCDGNSGGGAAAGL
jgi:hypothetical protein